MTKAAKFEQFRLSEELALYKASPQVLKKMGEVVLYAIVAPYGSGKDSIINWLLTNRPDKFASVVGDASRPPRKGEIDGADYHFRSKNAMADDLQNGRFVQVVPGFMGNFYATRPQQYPTDKIALKPIQAREMSNYKRLGLKDLKWLQIVPHSDEAWLDWQGQRIYEPQEQDERNQEAIQSYTLSLVNQHTLFILNDEIENASERILRVAEGQTLPDAAKARSIAVRNLEALKNRRGVI